jgi:hypothetical protein
MTSSEQEYIADRQERYRQAHNTMNLDTLDPWVSEDLDYSDYGTFPFILIPPLKSDTFLRRRRRAHHQTSAQRTGNGLLRLY